MTDRFIIGKITGAHCVRGEVKVFPITDNVRHFKKLKKVGLADNEGNIKKEMDISASPLPWCSELHIILATAGAIF